uniref:Uncharacterized protein n=1 Tax=Molossus molossus TaxID=27622 RepID=A0A7J8DTY6_MOLMO|nr:hypothetical protein HJG59_009153 [Molossus molossus]
MRVEEDSNKVARGWSREYEPGTAREQTLLLDQEAAAATAPPDAPTTKPGATPGSAAPRPRPAHSAPPAPSPPRPAPPRPLSIGSTGLPHVTAPGDGAAQGSATCGAGRRGRLGEGAPASLDVLGFVSSSDPAL